MELGPLLRSMRHHKGAFSLLVLEVAFGYVILLHALIASRYYLRTHIGDTGIADREIVVVTQRFLHPHDLTLARQELRRGLAALSELPGVTAVAALDTPPLPDGAVFPLALASRDGAPLAAWSLTATAAVVPTLGLRVIAGRGLDELPPGTQPAGDGEPVPLLVTKRLARQLFGHEAAAVNQPLPSESWARGRVVGVVDDFSFRGTWLPHADRFVVVGSEPVSEHGLTFALRAAPNRTAAVALAAHARLASAPDALLSVAPLRREEARYMKLSRGATIILFWTGFLVVAVALSGSLALASFSVAERTRQIGVRRALGACRGEIVRYFLLENLILTGFGLVLGVALSFGLNLVIGRLMAELAITADLTIASLSVFIVTGLLSALVPARRAAAIPPWAATRTL
jgi:putative ABC transport system permease protein